MHPPTSSDLFTYTSFLDFIRQDPPDSDAIEKMIIYTEYTKL
jgi:hypothetical protein